MFILNSKRINIYAQYTAPNGTRYANLTDPAIRAQLGVTEIADPTPPQDYTEDTYYRTEQDTAPYVIYTKKSDEQILEVMKSKFLAAVQGHLDTGAQAVGYDNIVSACSYAGAPNPFQVESQSFISWRGNVWAYCYQELAKVEAGTRPLPVLEDFLNELPARS